MLIKVAVLSLFVSSFLVSCKGNSSTGIEDDSSSSEMTSSIEENNSSSSEKYSSSKETISSEKQSSQNQSSSEKKSSSSEQSSSSQPDSSSDPVSSSESSSSKESSSSETPSSSSKVTQTDLDRFEYQSTFLYALNYDNLDGDLQKIYDAVMLTPEQKISFQFSVPRNGTYFISMRLGSDQQADSAMFTIDGGEEQLVLVPEEAKESWQYLFFTEHMEMELEKGKHTIEFYSTRQIALKTIRILPSLERPLRALTPPKFEPEDGKRLFFIGQDINSVGGTDNYSDGYLDYYKDLGMPRPSGWTVYSTLRPGDRPCEPFKGNSTFPCANFSSNFTYSGNDGIFTDDNWGSANQYADHQVNDPDYDQMAIAIGLELKGQEDTAKVQHEYNIASGEYDDMIRDLGNWFKSLGNRPVFLRIGYEYDGPWNHYDEPAAFVEAYRHIVDILDEQGVTNVAYVWQATCACYDQLESMAAYGAIDTVGMDYYPGDSYVDWLGVSHFKHYGDNMPEFGKERGKPVMIAEATPVNKTNHTGDGIKDIIPWSTKLFEHIEKHDNIKALAYISGNWGIEPMWTSNHGFANLNTRFDDLTDLLTADQAQEAIDLWTSTLRNGEYIVDEDNVYKLLGAE